MNGPIRIATRRSRLALWQAEHVAARIAALLPGRVVGSPGTELEFAL